MIQWREGRVVRERRRWAESVTAIEAEVISTNTPVA